MKKILILIFMVRMRLLCAITMVLIFTSFPLKAQDPCNPIYPIAGLGPAYQQTFEPNGTGIWNITLCGVNSSLIEKVYSFTAPYTATYKIKVVAGSCCVIYAWKQPPCDSTGWFCLGNVAGGTLGSMYWTPGTYYILLKSGGPYIYANHIFYIICEPNAPVLTVTAVSTNRIDLSWNDVEGETGYKIFRTNSPGGTFEIIGTTAANVTSFSDIGLTADDDYCYKVIAYNNDAESVYSNESCATTLPLPPSAPSNLVATAYTNSEVHLSWGDVTNETGYKIYRSLSPGGTYSLIDSTIANINYYDDDELKAQTQYCYRVKAYNQGGLSYYSDEDCCTTLAITLPTPTNLTALATSNTQINLVWNDVANESGYRIYRASAFGGTFVLIDSTFANIVSYVNDSLVDNTQYCYKVKAFNLTGESYFSNEVCATTYPNGVESYLKTTQYSVFPNPANDKIIIESKKIIKNETVSIYSMQGKLLIQQEKKLEKIEINISNLEKGLYFLKIKSDESITVKCIIKE